MDHTVLFETNRPRLLQLAYRMVGSLAEAEDLVQDAWLRWHGADREPIKEPVAWLTTTITRIAIDHMRSARTRRETYIGPWLPEPVLTTEQGPFGDHVELASHLSSALLMVLEKLAPTERAAFLLREVFDYDYADISPILATNETHCRQIVSRAKKRVRGERTRFEVSQQQRQSMMDSFTRAANEGDLQGLVQLFEKDIILYSDGGGKVAAALRPIYGADKVGRFIVGLSRKNTGVINGIACQLNGHPGLIGYEEDQLSFALSFHYGETGYREIHIVRNPDKLRRLEQALSGSDLS